MNTELMPQKQKFGHCPSAGVFGDCWRTAIAVAIGRPRDSVPHFVENGMEAFDDNDPNPTVKAWLRDNGFHVVTLYFDAAHTSLKQALSAFYRSNPLFPVVVTVQSRNIPDTAHCITAYDGRIVCDPATGEAASPYSFRPVPDENGGSYWWFDVIVPMHQEDI